MSGSATCRENGQYQYPHINVKIREMSPIWFIIRRTDTISEIRHLSDDLTCYKHCIPPSGTTQGLFRQSRVREAPIQRLLNGQIVAPGRGANRHCKGLHCWIQRILARIRHLLAFVRRRGCTMSNDRSIHSNKGLMWATGSPPGHHNMNPNDSK